MRLAAAVSTPVLLAAGLTLGSGPAAGAAPDPAERAFAAMSRAERVGQLLMVGCPSTRVTAACRSAIRTRHVGSVILTGSSTLSVAGQHRVTAALQAAAPASRWLLIATDQEGGAVRRMRGPGFSAMPSALTQGGWSTSVLRSRATTWGAELRRAGVSVDLAPVLDTVPAGAGNPPIGDLAREYGHTPARVTTKGLAVLRGLRAGGVAPTVKHFPGLGRVTRNTDTSAGVTDRVTTATDPFLRPFRSAVAAGAPLVMISTAVYTRVDARNPAAFSRQVVTGLLRSRLGFRGVVISDDLGAARQVAAVPVGQRAARFVAAGGDLVLTVQAGQARAMEAAIVARMTSSPSFRATVDAAVLRVLHLKQAQGLLR